MDKKKIIILTILFVAVAGLALAPVSEAAKTQKTDKLLFKQESDKRHSSFTTKNINKNSAIWGFYVYPKASSQYSKNTLYIGTNKYMDVKSDYKSTKIVIKFKKKVTGKTYYSTRTFYNNKPKKNWANGQFSYKPKNNYKPHTAVVYYEKVKK